MDPLRLSLLLTFLGMSLTAGCASSPWASTATPPAAPAAAPTHEPAPPSENTSGEVSKTQEQMLQEVMAELQELGVMDRESQEELIRDLEQTDPTIWPLVMQQFRARVAYQRRAEGNQENAHSGGVEASTMMASRPSPIARVPSAPEEPKSDRVGRLPPTENGALPPVRPPQENYPATRTPLSPIDRQWPGSAADAGSPRATNPDKIVATSHNSPVADDWRAYLAETIRALEAEIQGPTATQEDIVRHARLRLLYVLAGRREDAVEPIPAIGSASPGQGGSRKDQPMREYWSKQSHALATWLDVERTPNALMRAGETKKILSDAVASLGEAAPLAVRNLVFCKGFQSYGCYEQFHTDHFMPGQEVILYGEVENFSNASTSKGYHTSLRCRYEIFNMQGGRVAEQDLPETEEHCRNRRRDYFVAYRLRLPPHLSSGRYVLKLTVEDLRSNQIGESQLPFAIERRD